MKLIGMLGSPYIRRVAVSPQLLGLRFEHQVERAEHLAPPRKLLPTGETDLRRALRAAGWQSVVENHGSLCGAHESSVVRHP